MKKSLLLTLCSLFTASFGMNAQEAPTEVPVIKINIEGNQIVKDKETYLKASFEIEGKGQYKDFKDSIQIKGRGNSSWSPVYDWNNPKNPYKLKFAKKQAPFGLTKGKKWVLLANKIDGSLLTNAIGMEVARVVGTEAANDIIPVDLYINGEYRGNYNFTEQVDMSSNSVKLKDESKATLIELDTYYDEPYKFKDATYQLPANIKFPDFSEGGDETSINQNDIEGNFNKLTAAVANGDDLSNILDLNALGKYMLVNELIANFEILHPKSTYLYNADVLDNTSKWKFGPVWDLDWAYGYENTYNYGTMESDYQFWTKQMEHTTFWNVLLSHKEVKLAYYQVWKNFMENGLQEVLDYCDTYYTWTANSLSDNASKWWDNTDYAKQSSTIKSWLKARAKSIYDELKSDEVVVASVKRLNAATPAVVDVVDLNGRVVKHQVDRADWSNGLPAGVYVVGGKKVVVK